MSSPPSHPRLHLPPDTTPIINDPLASDRDDLQKYEKLVKLESWAASQPDPRAQEYFPSARKRMLEIASSITAAPIRFQAFEMLHRLFALDPVSENTCSSLCQTITALSAEFEAPAITKFTWREKQELLEVYATAMECMISHLGRGLLGKVTEDAQRSFVRAPNLLKELSNGSIRIDLKVDYAAEGAKRLESDRKVGEFLPTAISLIKLVADLAFQNYAEAAAEAKNIYAQYQKQIELDIKSWSWYESVYLFRHWGHDAVRDLSFPIHFIDRIAKEVFEKSGHQFSFFGHIIHPTLKKDCDWRVFLSAGWAYGHILRHAHTRKNAVDCQTMYEAVISSDVKKPGLMALVTLAEKTADYEKVAKGIVEEVEELLQERVVDRFDPARKTAFHKALCYLLHSLTDDLKRKLRDKVTESFAQKNLRTPLDVEPYDLFGNLMIDAVTTPEGNIYSKRAISSWILRNHTDPKTGTPLEIKQLKENPNLQAEIAKKTLPPSRVIQSKKSSIHSQLAHAIKLRDQKGIDQAIAQGADPVSYVDEKKNRALHFAAKDSSSLLFLQILLLSKKKEDLWLENEQRESPLSLAIQSSSEHMRVILQVYPDVPFPSKEMTEQFHKLVEGGRLKEVGFFLNCGQDVNAPLEKVTPFTRAVRANHFDVAESLFRSGADLQSQDVIQVFQEALKNEEIEQAKFLLNYGVGVQQVSQKTFFAQALAEKRFKVAKLAIDQGVDINEVPIGGRYNPLQQAVINKDEITVQFLLNSGADFNIFTLKNETLFDLAKKNVKMTQLLTKFQRGRLMKMHRRQFA